MLVIVSILTFYYISSSSSIASSEIEWGGGGGGSLWFCEAISLCLVTKPCNQTVIFFKKVKSFFLL